MAASTQNQALSAPLFLHREVPRQDLYMPIVLVWAKRPGRLPTVLIEEQVRQVIAQLTGFHRLIVQTLPGSYPKSAFVAQSRREEREKWAGMAQEDNLAETAEPLLRRAPVTP